MQILKREPSNLPMYEQQTKINNKRAKKKAFVHNTCAFVAN